MKRLFLFLAVAGLMATTACSRDEMESAGMNGDGVVTFSARLPEQLQTRSMGDGQTARKLTYAVYAAGEQTPLLTSESEGAPAVEFTDLKAQLTLRLTTGKSYDVLFWADAYGQKDESNPYKVDYQAQTVTVDYAAAESNDESRDAFFGSVTGMKVTGAMSQDVTLVRPFAQVNVGTDDLEEAVAGGLQSAALATSMSATNVPTTLNLLNGTTTGSTSVDFASHAVPTESLVVSGRTYTYLAMNYLLMGADKTTTNIAFAFTDGATTGNLTFSNVPVQRNYRTNIIGSVLTGDVDFDIDIDPGFGEPDHNLSQLLFAAENGGTVELEENMTLEQEITVAEGKKMELNLNGHDIVFDSEELYTAFNVNGDMVINGPGNISYKNGGILIVNKNGSLVINGGDFSSDVNCIQVYGGSLAINGGHFSVTQMVDGHWYLLNQLDSDPGTVAIKGGTFVNYDPATGDPGRGGDFLVEGYSSVKVSDDPATYEVIEGAGAATADELKAAIAEGEPVITLVGDIALSEVLSFPKDVTLTAQGDVTLTGAPVYFNGENTVVRGIHFANGTSSSGQASAVYVTSQKCRTLVFDNCTFSNAQWDAIQLTDKDVESIEITNCTFRNTVEGGYRYIHLELRNSNGDYYANAQAKVTVTGCTFENVSSAYCKDSAVTICGFMHDNLTIADNVVKGAGADNITNMMFWICDGTNFGKLFSTEELKTMFRYE
ncbi:DUF6562 domain-containing protein [uncultured Alistipes sp.]|uniref:DUF6562 domain-containing protein n=1 Tax=uncultured Alistipes sp. TaxID=538949 RepID=UPI0025E87A5D|nr:DUF6562 domain-containing protein [uncultured Alistipes sp.]